MTNWPWLRIGWAALCLGMLCSLLVSHSHAVSTASAVRAASPQGVVFQKDTTEVSRPAVDTTEADTTEADTTEADTTAVPDTSRGGRPGAVPADTSVGASPDTTGAEEGDLEAPIELAARDSLILTFGDPDSSDTGALYGEASATYQDNVLRAQTIQYRFDNDDLRATGPPSDTARIPFPVFEREGEDGFRGAELAFNLRSQRGRVLQARTRADDASLRGGIIKRFEERTTFVADGIYTTDDRPPGETPSYSLRSPRMKVMNERWVYTGPIQLYIFNIPTPLWLPFGIVPYTEGRRSGPLPPTYGEDQRRGFYLRDFGWYFAMNEFTDFAIRGGVWSGGSFEINPEFRYRRTDHYDGNLDLNMLFERIGKPEDPNFQKSIEGELRWRHNQDLSPTASVRGNIRLITSSDFTQDNTTDFNDAVRQDINSSLNYTKNWPDGGRKLTLSASQNQNLSSGNTNLTLPDLSFNQRSFKPFERDRVGQDEAWYERITTSYRGSLNNDFVYRPTDTTDVAWYEAFASPSAYREGHSDPDRPDPFDVEMSHRIPLSASFRVNRYNLNIRPNINYNSDWVLRTQRKQLVVDTLDTDDTTGVGTPVETEVERTNEAEFAARHEFSTGVSLNTEFFGTFPVELGSFRGLRHRVQPSLSYSYRPDFNNPFWGRTRSYVSDTDGTVQRYDIFSGRDVQGSTERQSLDLNISNRFETKRVRTDSTGATQENTVQLLSLNASTSYNLAADSLNLSDISMSARTSISDYNVNVRGTLSPYQYANVSESDDREQLAVVNRYMAARSPLTPVRLTRLNATLSGGFQSSSDAPTPSSRTGQERGRGRRTGASESPPMGGADMGSTRTASPGRVDFSIPWSVDFDLRYSMSRRFREADHDAEVRTRFSFSVTPKWRVSGQTTVDAVQTKIATTQLSAYRDLGAWEMSFSWVPFGRFQSYSFSLNVKGGQLRNLLQLNVPRNETGSRLGGAAGGLLSGGSGGGRRGGGGRPF
ncbi:MAG: putative LPS assembly protein LptD [Longimonas sp.]|uniref:putative LPS assembly protein LptD n=1 Tax=Longimonas sp. TaxID=2039626 RepID=UPI003974C1BE